VPRIESAVNIEAPTSVVWGILADSAYVPKLFRDAVRVEASPPGRSAVGQSYDLTAKVGRIRTHVFLEVVEVEPGVSIATRQKPGGLFRSFRQRTVLEPTRLGTRARTVFEYELSRGYLGQVLNAIVVERLVKDNLRSYSYTLKELSELLPPPSERKTK